MSEWDDFPSASEWDDFTPDGPPVTQRTVAGVMDSEWADKVRRARGVGVSDKDIPAYFNPPDAVRGDSWLPGWYEDYQVGIGALLTNVARGAEQTSQHLTPGQDTSAIDAQVAEHKALQERGGMNANSMARLGQMTAGAALLSAAPMVAPEAFAASPAITAGLEGAVMTAAEGETDPDYWEGKGESALLNVGAGAGTAKAMDLGIKGLTATRNVPNAVTDYMAAPQGGRFRPVSRASAADIAEGNRLAGATGIDLTLGQRGQSPSMLAAEQYVRESTMSRELVAEGDKLRNQQLEEGLNLYANSLGPQVPKEIAAKKLQSWVEDHADEMYAHRQAQADQDYAPVQQWDQGNPSIPATNYHNALLKIINEGRGTGAGADAVAAAAEATRRLGAFNAQGRRLTGMDVDRITRAADGEYGGTVFDVNSRRYGSELTGALNRAVRQDVKGIKPLDKLLYNAKVNYAKNSDSIEALEHSGLGKVVGEELAGDLIDLRYNRMPPGKVFDTLWRLDPIDTRITFQYLDTNNPQAANELRQALLREGIEAAKIRPAAGGVGGEMIPGDFLRFMGVTGTPESRLANQQRLKAWFAGTDEEPLWNDLLAASQRLADMTNANTSRTNIRQETGQLFAFAANQLEDAKKAQSLFQWITNKFSDLGKLATTQISMRGLADRMNPNSPGYLVGKPRYQMAPADQRRLVTLPPIPAMVASQELQQ